MRVDRKARVIHRVKVVGLRSANPSSFLGLRPGTRGDSSYEYSLDALREAIPLYEGAPVNIDHVPYSVGTDGVRRTADVKRKTAERFGRLANVGVESDGLYADLQYLAAHPLAPLILEAAERMPEALALSHHAVGIPTMKDGRVVVDKIVAVRSVDLIGERPGTTTSLFESLGATEPMEEPVSVADPLDEDLGPENQDVRAALRDLLEDQSLDDAGLVEQLDEIIRRDNESTDVDSELASLAQRVSELEEREAARGLLESRNIRPTDALVRSLANLTDDAERAALIESLSPSIGASGPYVGLLGRRPASSRPASAIGMRREPGGKGLARAVKG